jgi:putative membrane protein
MDQFKSAIRRFLPWICAMVLVIFYTVGMFGITGAHPEKFVPLSWLILLISVAMIVLPMEKLSSGEAVVMFAIMVLGFIVEVIGVMTGALFGEYHYGASLGWKFYDVPLVIGVNWLIMVFAAHAVAGIFFSHWLLLSLSSALLMVGMDYLIEPVAMQLDFWQWKDDVVPFRNYAAWFVFGFLFQLMFTKAIRPGRNAVAILLYALMALFFLVVVR